MNARPASSLLPLLVLLLSLAGAACNRAGFDQRPDGVRGNARPDLAEPGDTPSEDDIGDDIAAGRAEANANADDEDDETVDDDDEAEDDPPRAASADGFWKSDEEAERLPTTPGAGGPAAAEAEEKKPDYGAILRGQLASVGSCVPDSIKAAHAGRVSISVSANITASGRVSSASVSTSLPAEVAKCVEDRALAARFAALEGADSETASTTLEFEITAPKVKEVTVVRRNGEVVSETPTLGRDVELK